ncbi:MAG: hypothetical protein GY870_09210 [archaeon]|nr:hypothetical protein [archaeon]
MSDNWISIYHEKPKEGQIVMSKINEEEGYCGKSVYINGYFETYEDHRNRLTITRWKHNMWKATQQ